VPSPSPRLADAPPTPAAGAPARGNRPAAHRALPVRRLPRAVELADAGSGAVLTSVLEGLRALPDRPVRDARTRMRNLLRALWRRLDLPGLALVGGAGVAASVVFTAVLLLWLAGVGRLG
jgi:hypothetical protein